MEPTPTPTDPADPADLTGPSGGRDRASRYRDLLGAVLAGAMGSGSWPWERPVTGEQCRAAAEAGELLGSWRDWPDARGGLRVGIVADVSRTMDPYAPCVTSLAWVLALAAFESARGGPWYLGPVRPVVITAEEHYENPYPHTPPGGARPGLAAARESASTAYSISEGIARAAHAVRLRATAGARLLVVITDRHARSVDPDRIDELTRAGCGVLTICPARQVDFPPTATTAATTAATGAMSTGVGVGVLGPGAGLHVVDPTARLDGRSLAVPALDAMRRAEQARQPRPR